MHGQSGWNMYVFRNGRTEKNGAELIRDLANSVRRVNETCGYHGELWTRYCEPANLSVPLPMSDRPSATCWKKSPTPWQLH